MKYYQEAGGSTPGKQIEHTGTCDICGAANQESVYDANLIVNIHRRIWAWACPSCFVALDGKLGVGQGQHYRRVQ